ncbi:NTP transferase domain-containing protein [Aquimarina sp. RZ0]|uniref:nucleotidyltransferase family protein n=1 Tax=Aquimarina sp. RZ0 TaxID=2607730 RepID=UPI0011F27666|nr:nucleotidyltransferase family protein [Aquimarina sp. RZ0]KAA1245953.1 nucleotidyltransferase family protein [Aquimarina sp. RZ0]
MIKPVHTVQLILAAGSSSRMGCPKQLLPWKNSSLLVFEIEKSLQLAQVFTVVVLGANFEIIKKEIAHFPIVIIYNQHWKSGMGTSISCGIQYALEKQRYCTNVLITLIDQPLIDMEHLDSLMQKSVKHPDKIIATQRKNNFGVPAIFPKRYFKELYNLAEDYGARYLLKQYKDSIVSVVDDYNKTADIDTLEQYTALLQRMKE